MPFLSRLRSFERSLSRPLAPGAKNLVLPPRLPAFSTVSSSSSSLSSERAHSPSRSNKSRSRLLLARAEVAGFSVDPLGCLLPGASASLLKAISPVSAQTFLQAASLGTGSRFQPAGSCFDTALCSTLTKQSSRPESAAFPLTTSSKPPNLSGKPQTTRVSSSTATTLPETFNLPVSPRNTK